MSSIFSQIIKSIGINIGKWLTTVNFPQIWRIDHIYITYIYIYIQEFDFIKSTIWLCINLRIHKYQFGFRQMHFTRQTIIPLVEKIGSSLNASDYKNMHIMHGDHKNMHIIYSDYKNIHIIYSY